MKRILLIFLTAMLSLQAYADFEELNLAEAEQMIAEGVPVIDVRTEQEWQQTGVIEGAHLLTFYSRNGTYDTEAWLKQLSEVTDPDEPFILICRSGNRSGRIGKLLGDKYGYPHVSHVKGGISSWIRQGKPVLGPDQGR